MATAALVLGILSWFCIPFIGGVLAVVLGIMGMKKAAELGGNGKGMAMAGAVIGGLGLLVWTVGSILFVFALGEAADNLDDALQNIGGVADPSSYDIETGDCEVDRFGFATFDGTITNTTGSTKSFWVNADFRDADTGVLITNLTDLAETIAPGDTVRWEITASVGEGTDVKCELTTVENWFN